MQILRLAAFAEGAEGGNPAGVALLDTLPDAAVMQQVAADVGYSETAFAAVQDGAWRVRYFSPGSEVPFCGHATIALGAALALRHGDGEFALQLNQAAIRVRGRREAGRISAMLQSPPTRSRAVAPPLLQDALQLFGLSAADLDPALAPAHIHAGADHLLKPPHRPQPRDLPVAFDPRVAEIDAQALEVGILAPHGGNGRGADGEDDALFQA